MYILTFLPLFTVSFSLLYQQGSFICLVGKAIIESFSFSVRTAFSLPPTLVVSSSALLSCSKISFSRRDAAFLSAERGGGKWLFHTFVYTCMHSTVGEQSVKFHDALTSDSQDSCAVQLSVTPFYSTVTTFSKRTRWRRVDGLPRSYGNVLVRMKPNHEEIL